MENPFRRQLSYNSINRNRILRQRHPPEQTHKICKTDPKVTPKHDRKRTQLKAFVDLIPQDQSLIEDYIQELKLKLRHIKHSSSSKCSEVHINKTKHLTEMGSQRKSSAFDERVFPQPIKYENVRNQAKKEKIVSKGKLRAQKLQIELFPRKKSESAYRLSTESLRKDSKSSRMYRYQSAAKHKYTNIGESVIAPQNENYGCENVINLHQHINFYNDSSTTPHRVRVINTEETGQKQKEGQPEKIGDLSTIEMRKETIGFLGDTGIHISEQLKESQHKQGEKLLDYVGWKTQTLTEALSGKSKRRKYEFDKLSKIFPKGFFQ